MKIVAVVGLLGILLVPILGMSAARISIGTGPWSRAYFPVGEAIEKTRLFVEKHLVPMAFRPWAEQYWRERKVLR
jgi:hypothetical protein